MNSAFHGDSRAVPPFREAVFSVPHGEQTAVFDGDGRRFACEVVADAQGEAGGQGAVFEGVMEALDGDAMGVVAQAEEGKNALGAFVKGNRTISDDGDDIVPAHEAGGGIMVRQELEGLEIGDGVVQPRAPIFPETTVPELCNPVRRRDVNTPDK